MPFFQKIRLHFTSNMPCELNGRALPVNRIFKLLSNYAYHIQDLYIILEDEILPPDI
jgi:hypothetical protein